MNDAVQQILNQDRHDLAAARSDLNNLIDAQNATDPKLVTSTQPLRTQADNGQQAPVDLSLGAQGSSYVPANPLVDLKLPANLTNDAAVGDQGIKVDVGATQGATADPITGGDNLFYHEAATDTDVVLAPVSVGLETFYQLRSPQSPEHFTLGFTLPVGASLQSADGEAAQIVKGGQTIAVIPTPSASDASGNPVPLTTSVNGDSLELSVPHQDPSISYPINVDPVIDTYVGTNGNIADFTANWSTFQPSTSYYALGSTCTQNISCTSGTTGSLGLYVNATPNHTFTANQAAGWLYSTPHYPSTTAYISAMTLGAINLHLHTGTATTPYLAAGIFAPSTFSWLDYKTRSTTSDGLYWDFTPPSQTASTGKMAGFEMIPSATQNLGAWRDAYLGYAAITLADTDNPTASIDTGPLTSGWIDGNQTKTFPVTVSDGGVGAAGLWGPGPNGNDTQTFNNSGTDCTGTRVNPCPQSGQLTAGYYPGKTPEGQSTSAVWGWDAIGKVVGQTWNVKVDGSPPTISTSGGLSQSASGDPYKLTVDATDGNASDSTGAGWRSGVGEIKIEVNGNQVADQTQSCAATAGSCAMSLDYTPGPSDLTSNNLHFKVTATDELGHPQTKEWDVTLPDTSIDSGPSGPTNNATPSFTYSSSVPGSSFQCRIDGGAYSSCSVSGYTGQHLADGQHTFDVRAINSAGLIDQTPASRTLTVDTVAPAVTIDSGPSGPTADSKPTFAFSSDDSSATFSCTVATDGQDEAFDSCSGVGVDRPIDALLDGSNTFMVRATDPAGNVSTATRSFLVDSSPPTIIPSGNLTNRTAVAPYRLQLSASDGDSASDSGGLWESGVKRIDLFINGTQVATTGDQACAGLHASCGAALDYSLPAHHVFPNDLHLTVSAVDQVGNVSTEQWDATIGEANTRPALTLSGDLFTAPAGWVDQLHSYSLVAAAQDAAGASALEVLIDGQNIDKKTQACDEGGCSLTANISVSPADYSGGTHTIKVIGTDAAGDATSATWPMNVDPSGTVATTEAINTLKAVDATTQTATVEPPADVLPASEIADGYDPALVRSGPDLQSTGTPNASSMTTSLGAGFTIAAPDRDYSVTPTAVAGMANGATVANDIAAVTSDARPEVDAVVSPIYNGDTTSEAIRSADSPQTYSWQVDLGPGQTLEATTPQSAEIYNADGSPAMLISTEDAVDAAKTPVDTTLTVSGSVVSLTILHHADNYIYPVVAFADWQTGYESGGVTADPNGGDVLQGAIVPTIVDAPVMDPAEQAPVEPLFGHHPHRPHRKIAPNQACAQAPFGCNNWKTNIRGYFHYNGHYSVIGGYAWLSDNDMHTFRCNVADHFPVMDHRGPHGWRGPRKARYGKGRHLSGVCNYEITTYGGLCKGQKIWVHPYGDGYFTKGNEPTDYGCEPYH
ncbi:MAG: Ig-like domain-containing protein [Solirubrobacterales bacterium]